MRRVEGASFRLVDNISRICRVHLVLVTDSLIYLGTVLITHIPDQSWLACWLTLACTPSPWPPPCAR